MAILRRKNLPLPVTLTRLAIALCVFSFCFMIHLSMFLVSKPFKLKFNPTIVLVKAQTSLFPGASQL